MNRGISERENHLCKPEVVDEEGLFTAWCSEFGLAAGGLTPMSAFAELVAVHAFDIRYRKHRELARASDAAQK